MPNQEAPTVAKLLVEEFVVRFGVPRQLHSDQGRNFESAVFGEMSTARHRQDQDYSPEISVRWHGQGTTVPYTGGHAVQVCRTEPKGLGRAPAVRDDGLQIVSARNHRMQSK